MHAGQFAQARLDQALLGGAIHLLNAKTAQARAGRARLAGVALVAGRRSGRVGVLMIATVTHGMLLGKPCCTVNTLQPL